MPLDNPFAPSTATEDEETPEDVNPLRQQLILKELTRRRMEHRR